MDHDSIIQYISNTFDGVDIVVASQEAGSPEIAWGDVFFSCDPNRMFPFATIVTKDYPGDNASNLNRPSVFRLNIGVSRETYRSLFGSQASSSGADGGVDGSYDFAALDQLLPHPVYGRMNWVCVLNPSDATSQSLRPLLREAYDLSVRRHTKGQPADER